MHKYLIILVLSAITASANAFWGEATPQPHAHTCVLLSNELIKCSGSNRSGQLGYGDTQSRQNARPTDDPALPYVDLGTKMRVLKVVMGANHTCALLKNHKVKCWGDNDAGQLGQPIDLAAGSPGDEPGEMGDSLGYSGDSTKRINDLYAQNDRTRVYYADGSSECWGN